MNFAKFARRLAPMVGFLLVPSVGALPAVATAAATTNTSSSASQSSAPSTLVKVQAAPQLPQGTTALGAMAASAPVSGAVALQPRNDAALEAFIGAVTDPSSTLYHQYLAAGQFDSEFGPLPATVSAVEQAVEADGLSVTGVASDGLLVDFTGTAGQAETTFHTQLQSYRMKAGWTGHGTTEPVQLLLPSSISGAVTGVIGLDDLVHAQALGISGASAPAQSGHPAAQAPAIAPVAGAPTACTAAQQAATVYGGLTDDQIANAYGAFGLYRQGDFGQGEHIGVFEEESFDPSDVETFDTCYFGAAEAAQMSGTDGNLAGSRLSVTSVDGGQPPGPGSGEAILDVSDVSAMAPEADIDVYVAPNTSFGTIDNYAAMVDSDTDQVITTSWGLCEQALQVASPGLQQEENFLFQQAAAQGQTVLSAAGDAGDDDCNSFELETPPPGQNFLSVDDPGSQPYVVSVGGTTIDDATQPPSEHVWNDGANGGGGGGGISETWVMPSWQRPVVLTTNNATDVANAEAYESETAATSAPFTTPTFCDGALGVSTGTPCREVPDVSAQADEFTGAVTVYSLPLADGWFTIGGTSSATPIWAAMLILIDASRYCSEDLLSFAGGKVADAGFASPILYGIAANSTAYAHSFNDITVGNNDDFGLDNGLVFPARAGYDMASGLGSPQVTSASGGLGLAYYMCEYGSALHPPAVTALSPTYGPLPAGDAVTVTGTGFQNAAHVADVASVQVGNATAPSFNVVSNTTLTLTLPAAASTTGAGSPDPTQDGAGRAEIVVTLTDGESSSPGAASTFDFVDETSPSGKVLPSVTGVSPYGGVEATTSPPTVTLLGSGFEACPGGGSSCSSTTLTSTVKTVDFGGVPAAGFTVVSPYELSVKPPAFSALDPAKACPVDNGAPGQPLNPEADICQVEVTVSTAAGTSQTAAILPPYEGPATVDSMAVGVLPPGCGCEEFPQTSEYDYAPPPTITSVSTGTQADLPANAADLADEFGGAATNTVVLNGTGMDPLVESDFLLGSPPQPYFPLYETGTSVVLMAPPLLAPGSAPTVEPVGVPVGYASLAGTTSLDQNIVYAGVANVTSVVNTSNSRTLDGVYGAPDTGGAPLDIQGQGFLQTVGPVTFQDNLTGAAYGIPGFSTGTQYNYSVNSDTDISTDSVMQNPALVDVELCSETGCSAPSSQASPPSSADELLIYPPGAPVVTAVSPSSGPAAGGTTVTISGDNLGCAVAATFGSAPATNVSNEQALLYCGTTGLVDATSPPGTPASTVAVTVETAESVLAPSTPVSQATFTYTGKPGSPTVTSASSATAQVGTSFSFSVTTSGAPPITVSLAGPLPTGVHFTAESGGAGLIHGTPAAGTGGVYYFTIQAQNGAGEAFQPFTLTVNQTPALTATSPEDVMVGEPVSFVVTSTGYPTPDVSVSTGTLPAGLNASDGTDGLLVISGTAQPGSAGKYRLTISATNTVGTANKSLTIVVSGAS